MLEPMKTLHTKQVVEIQFYGPAVNSMDDKAVKLQNLLQHADTESLPDSELTEQTMCVSVIAPVLHVLNDLRHYKEMETIQR